MAELKVTVPIKFSEKAQKDLYETCMGYKELAEMLGAENDKLRELIKFAYDCATSGVSCRDCDLVFGKGTCQLKSDLESAGIEVGK